MQGFQARLHGFRLDLRYVNGESMSMLETNSVAANGVAEQVKAVLATVIDPNTGKDFASTKAVKIFNCRMANSGLEIELGYPAKSQLGLIRRTGGGKP